MAFKESNFQSLVTNKFKEIFKGYPVLAIELKICKDNRFYFSRLEDHQIKALMDATGNEGVYHKISDAGYRYTDKLPFDCFFISHAKSFIGILFYEERKKKMAYFIDIDTWLEYTSKMKMKSVTEDDCLAMASIVYNFSSKKS